MKLRKQKMKRTLVVCLALALASCGGKPGAETGSSGMLINGAGATFPYPIYSKWFDEFHKIHPDIRINYQSIGSGGGIRQLQAGTVDFGASDSPMNDEQISKSPAPPLHFPTVLGAVVPVYNVTEVTQELKFTPEVLSGIFLGKIRKWNDSRIKAANAGIQLSATDIVVVHRSDGSGTTFVWTDYLSKVSPEWSTKVGSGTSVNWPVGLGAKGNEGVAGLVKQTPNSIGYVELVYAIQNKMPYGPVRNQAGEFVKASLDSVTAAAASAKMPPDFRVSITNPPGKDVYPISSFTWLIVPSSIPNAWKRTAITEFLRWMLSEGQKLAPSLDYAPLPAEVVSMETEMIARVK
jgi:phosphate transport system substrate-binding protein